MHCLTKKVGSALFILNRTFNFRGFAPKFMFILNQTFNFRESAPKFMFILRVYDNLKYFSIQWWLEMILLPSPHHHLPTISPPTPHHHHLLTISPPHHHLPTSIGATDGDFWPKWKWKMNCVIMLGKYPGFLHRFLAKMKKCYQFLMTWHIVIYFLLFFNLNFLCYDYSCYTVQAQYKRWC